MTRTSGQQYMLDSRLQCLGTSEQDSGVPQPPLQLEDSRLSPPIVLPDPQGLLFGHVDLRQVIENRATLRKYTLEPLSLEELSYLLWCTQGVKSVTARPATQRTVPSAGARHAFETILLVNHVAGLQAGLYRFLAIEHQLTVFDRSPELVERVILASRNERQLRACAATFFWVAVLPRMRWRYGERSYRYLHLDAGHVCQNLYLAAESIGCGVCAIGAYDDDEMNRAFQLDGEDQFVIYAASLGKRPGASA